MDNGGTIAGGCFGGKVRQRRETNESDGKQNTVESGLGYPKIHIMDIAVLHIYSSTHILNQ